MIEFQLFTKSKKDKFVFNLQDSKYDQTILVNLVYCSFVSKNKRDEILTGT